MPGQAASSPGRYIVVVGWRSKRGWYDSAGCNGVTGCCSGSATWLPTVPDAETPARRTSPFSRRGQPHSRGGAGHRWSLRHAARNAVLPRSGWQCQTGRVFVHLSSNALTVVTVRLLGYCPLPVEVILDNLRHLTGVYYRLTAQNIELVCRNHLRGNPGKVGVWRRPEKCQEIK